MIAFISVILLTFALALMILGLVTLWLERRRQRSVGLAMVLAGLLVASTYVFLSSRFSIALFGRLIIALDLPHLMGTALTYTVGVLFGGGLAVALFLWVTSVAQPSRVLRRVVLIVLAVLVVALAVVTAAVGLSMV